MRKSLAAGAVAALLAGPALADGFSYNNLELGFVDTEIEDFDEFGDIEGDGLSLGGSVEFGAGIHGFGKVTGLEFEDILDVGTLSLGLGFNHALAPQLDLFSGISYERLKFEYDGFDIPLPFHGSDMPDRTKLDAIAVQIMTALRDPMGSLQSRLPERRRKAVA